MFFSFLIYEHLGPIRKLIRFLSMFKDKSYKLPTMLICELTNDFVSNSPVGEGVKPMQNEWWKNSNQIYLIYLYLCERAHM